MTPPLEPAPEPYAFTPVALARVRHDGWTPERQRGFIEILAVTGVVSAAAKAVGMSAQSAYRLRDRPGAKSFAVAWDSAQDEGFLRALSLAMERGIKGYTVPRFYAGREVARIHRFDNRMAMAALNTRARMGRRPGGWEP
ncbi:hypothetical protein [uncultured Sphingomonas sp.]|uniref:hypothetical protein n=1 Tax=uncultured Sphingomonas sp. TaxID=158754 RepID=UPI0035CC97AE